TQCFPTRRSSDLAKKQGDASIEDLKAQTWILREEGSGTREAAENVFQQLNIQPEHVMNFSSTQPIKVAIEAGLGISLLSKWAIQKELRNGELKIIDVKELPFTRQFSIVTATPFQTKALQIFINLFRHNRELNVFDCK